MEVALSLGGPLAFVETMMGVHMRVNCLRVCTVCPALVALLEGAGGGLVVLWGADPNLYLDTLQLSQVKNGGWEFGCESQKEECPNMTGIGCMHIALDFPCSFEGATHKTCCICM